VPSLTTLITPIVYGALIGGIAYSGYKVVEQLSKDTEYLPTLSCQEQGYVMNRKKEGRIDPSLPTDPLNDPNYEDISHPEEKESGHHTLKDKRTGEKLRFDEGKPHLTGHRAKDHFHRLNPKATSRKDLYLDEKGNPVAEKSEESHLYPPEWVKKIE